MSDRLSAPVPVQGQPPSPDLPVEREGAWSAPGTRTRSSWGTDPALRAQGTFRCVLHGEVDFASREHLLAIARDFEACGLPRAEVDVAGVTFVDSTALSMLLTMRRTATDRGGEVVLVAPGRRLRRLLTIAGMTALFTVDGSSTD